MHIHVIYIREFGFNVSFFELRSTKIQLVGPLDFRICKSLGQGESNGQFRSSESTVDGARRHFSRNGSFDQEN